MDYPPVWGLSKAQSAAYLPARLLSLIGDSD
jgi:hypothetical protein